MGLWLDVVRLGCGGASVGARSTSDDIVAGELGLGLRRNARLVQPLLLVRSDDSEVIDDVRELFRVRRHRVDVRCQPPLRDVVLNNVVDDLQIGGDLLRQWLLVQRLEVEVDVGLDSARSC